MIDHSMNTTYQKVSFFTFLILILENILLQLQLLIDHIFVRLANRSRHQQLIQNKIGLSILLHTLWKLKIKSSSQTLPKYLSSISTKLCISYRTISSFWSLSTMVMKQRLANLLQTILYYLQSRKLHIFGFLVMTSWLTWIDRRVLL